MKEESLNIDQWWQGVRSNRKDETREDRQNFIKTHFLLLGLGCNLLGIDNKTENAADGNEKGESEERKATQGRTSVGNPNTPSNDKRKQQQCYSEDLSVGNVLSG